MDGKEMWKQVDGAMKYVMSWVWMVTSWMWPLVVLCLMLSGAKEVLAIGDWVPDVGEPLYWAYTAGVFWLVKPK